MVFQSPQVAEHPTPPVPPTPPTPPTPPSINGVAPQLPVDLIGSAAPRELYEAAQAQRNELRNQLDRLEEKRDELSRELRGENTPDGAKPGIEARIKEVDARISAVDQQIAQADQQVAQTAAIPGATAEPPRPPRQGPPDEVFIIPVVFTIFVLFPIAIAYARRIWKKGATIIAPVPQEVRDRLEQLGDAVDSIGLEVERIGEGQRFITKVLSDNSRSLGVGAAQPIPVPRVQGEQVSVGRET